MTFVTEDGYTIHGYVAGTGEPFDEYLKRIGKTRQEWWEEKEQKVVNMRYGSSV